METDLETFRNANNPVQEDDLELEEITAFSFTTAIQKRRPIPIIEEFRSTLTRQCLKEGGSISNLSRTNALKYAVLNQYTDYAIWLLANHASEALKPTCCPLILTAVSHDQRQIVDAMCKYSKQVKMGEHKAYLDLQGCDAMERSRTALHIGAGMGSVTVVTTLIRHGANPFIKDQFSLTPLEWVLEMPSTHLNFNNLRAAVALLKCYPALQPKLYRSWNRLVNMKAHWKARLTPEFRNMDIGTFSLTHLARLKVRETIGYSRLPDGVNDLPVPKLVRKFINMEL